MKMAEKNNKEEDEEEPNWGLRVRSNEEEEAAKNDFQPARPDKQMHLSHFVRRNSTRQ